MNDVVHRKKMERMMLTTSLYDGNGNDRGRKLYWGGGCKIQLVNVNYYSHSATSHAFPGVLGLFIIWN